MDKVKSLLGRPGALGWSQVDQVTAPSSTQPCLASYHSAQSQPARQGQQSLQVRQPECLQEVCLCMKHPLSTCPLSRSSTSPGDAVLCCHWSNLGSMPLATLTQYHQVCKFSALYLLRERWGWAPGDLLLRVLCIKKTRSNAGPETGCAPTMRCWVPR